jgi:hypothetical protein
MSRSIRAGFAAALVASAFVASPASASTVSVKAKLQFKVNSAKTAFKGTGKDGKLGSFTVKGAFSVPEFNMLWTFKGGTIKLHVIGKLTADGYPIATWKVLSGTGKYKGASGSGKTTSQTKIGAPTAKQTYKGKIKF